MNNIGYDFSHWQSEAIFDKYSKDSDFIIHKLSEGERYVDPCAYYRLNKVRTYVNRPNFIGLYHFYNDSATCLANSDNFIKRIKDAKTILTGTGIPIVPIIDWEGDNLNKNKTANLINMAQTVKVHLKVAPLIYTSQYYIDKLDIDDAKNLGCMLWVARWGKNKPVAKGLWEDTDILIWQKANSVGNISLDVNEIIGFKSKLPMIHTGLDKLDSDAKHCCCCHCEED